MWTTKESDMEGDIFFLISFISFSFVFCSPSPPSPTPLKTDWWLLFRCKSLAVSLSPSWECITAGASLRDRGFALSPPGVDRAQLARSALIWTCHGGLLAAAASPPTPEETLAQDPRLPGCSGRQFTTHVSLLLTLTLNGLHLFETQRRSDGKVLCAAWEWFPLWL